MAKRRIDSRFNQKTHRPGSKNFGKIIRSLQFPAGKLASTGIPRLHQRNTRMARKASSKPESSNSTATIGFEAQNGGQSSGARSTAKANSQDESSGVHQFGVQPKGNANFRWVQHLIHHLATHGMAGFVLANGSMSSNRSGEGDIRRA